MRHRTILFALLFPTALGCAASPDPAPTDESTATSSASALGGFPPPPVDLYISNVKVMPVDASVTVKFTTGDIAWATITVGTGDFVGGGTIMGSANDGWPGTDHSLTVSGLTPCVHYWYRIDANGYEQSHRFTTSSATVDAFDVTQINYQQARVHVRTSTPTPVTLRLSQNQLVKTQADWSTTMSNPGGVEHNYFFALNGPRYVVEALPSSCGGWVPRWASFDHWPSEYGDAPSPAPTGLDFPSDRNIGYFDQVQGVAHGDDAWFISRKGGLVKIPRTASLDVEGLYPEVDIPAEPASAMGASDHIGDVDFSAGYLYVPLETAEGASTPPKVMFYDKDLGYLGWTVIAPGATVEVPWVAVNPINGLLYTSVFDVGVGVGRQIRAFRINRDASGKPGGLTRDAAHDFVPRDASGNPMTIRGVQGGAFSPMGHLYLSSDAPNYKYFGGVLAFDVTTGKQKLEMSIDYQARKPFTDYYEELEGIDIWDLAPGEAPGISGQIHVMMGKYTNGNLWFNSIWFKHFGFSTNEGKWWR